MTRKDIIQELSELQSSLGAEISQPSYAVPEGFFAGFASQVLNRIKAQNANDPKEELLILSPLLSEFSKNTPYAIPAGYFENFATEVLARIKKMSGDAGNEVLNDFSSPLLDNISKEIPYEVPQGYFENFSTSIMANIHSQSEFQSAEEELESLSPLLSSLNKRLPFSVPEGYFENFQVAVAPVEKQEAKVIKMGGRPKWYRFAVAAAVIGIVVLGGMLFLKPSTPGKIDASNSHAWLEQNMNKVSTTDINNFIQLTNNDALAQNQSATASLINTEVKDLMKDVSENDIQNFLNETEISEESSDDLFLN